MATHDYRCHQCLTIFEERHSIKEGPPQLTECPECGSTAERQFSAPNFSTRGDDLNGGQPQYIPALARRMPYLKDDPKAMFTSKRAAREAARRKADTGDYQLHFD